MKKISALLRLMWTILGSAFKDVTLIMTAQTLIKTFLVAPYTFL
jgi:hypothetical protein